MRRAPLEEVQRLAPAYGDLDRPGEGADALYIESGVPPIVHAVGHGNAPAYLWLAGQGVDLGPRTGRTLLHRAAEIRAPVIVRDFLARGFDPNAPDERGRTPVRLASDFVGKDADGALDAFFLLVNAGGRAEPEDLARMLFVAVHRAAPVASILRGMDSAYAERFRAQRREGLAAVPRLLALGADVDLVAAFANSYIIVPRLSWKEAAAYGDLDLLRLVLPPSRLARSAEPRLTDLARRNRNEHIVRELLRRGFPAPTQERPR